MGGKACRKACRYYQRCVGAYTAAYLRHAPTYRQAGMLEDGVDIMSIRKFLGHESIETTMVYLHVARPSDRPVKSALDRLYNQ
jgi:site-specific recombinase XerD